MKSPSKSSSSLLDRFINLIEAVPGSDRFVIRIVFFAVIATGIWLLLLLNQQYSETTPTRGGSFTEGIIGTPRFVNPALAPTRADQDITALVYSGLMKIDPNGNLVNDVADNINISEDGLTYNITVKHDLKFHDGTPLTAHDVVYTIQLIQNSDLKSPLRGNWTDVIVEEVNVHELNVTLEEAYAPFIENFTIGIMPAHIWSKLSTEQLPFSQFNTEPIGSGPFAITDVKRDATGLINHYTLSAFRENTDNPKLDNIKVEFYQNEDQLITALSEQQIDATTYLPPESIAGLIGENYRLIEDPLPRTFGIFFNQNHSTVLRDNAVREALTVALDRDILIENSLHGYGVPIVEPIAISQNDIESDEVANETSTTTATSTPTAPAIDILKAGGWSTTNQGLWEKEINDETVTLSITLRTRNAPLFESLIDSIFEQWKTIGVQVTIEQFEQTDLVQSVIRPRDFEALLYGLDISRSHDLYPFWHSSQQDDPGLNIAQYANVTVDELLETARTEQSEPDRLAALREASEIIVEESPAIFLFQPTMTYVVKNEIFVPKMDNIGRQADRFSNISEWHTESDSLWPLFRDDM